MTDLPQNERSSPSVSSAGGVGSISVFSYGFTTLTRWARLEPAAYLLRSEYAVCVELWRWQRLPR